MNDDAITPEERERWSAYIGPPAATQIIKRLLHAIDVADGMRREMLSGHKDEDGDWKEGHGPGRCYGCDFLTAYDAAVKAPRRAAPSGQTAAPTAELGAPEEAR